MKSASTMPPVVRKPTRIRELKAVDAAGLATLVDRIGENTWVQEDRRKENNFDCFDDTRHIVFRFIRGNRDPRDYYSNPSWCAWRDRLLPVMACAIKPYGFRQPLFPKVMLARLLAGGSIDLHRDGAGSNPRTHKIHVPLKTNPQSCFIFEDCAFHLKQATAYEVNNLVRHGGRNDGESDRIHLIFEVLEGEGIVDRDPSVVAMDA